jgi:uncharacterized protein (DUF1330 family)
MPWGYFFGEFEITDPATHEALPHGSAEYHLSSQERILVRGGEPQPFDGSMVRRRFVIVEFDSPGAARAFYLLRWLSGGTAGPGIQIRACW